MNRRWQIDPNQSAVDQYSTLHFAYGYVLGRTGWSAPIALLSSLAFEWAIEPALKVKYPGVFPAPSQDSFINRATDTGFVMLGWYLGARK